MATDPNGSLSWDPLTSSLSIDADKEDDVNVYEKDSECDSGRSEIRTRRRYSLDEKDKDDFIESRVKFRSVSGYIEHNNEVKSPVTQSLNESMISENTIDEEEDTPTSSSRPESTASLNNVLLYDEFSASDGDLNVTVDKPEKIIGTMDTFVLFRIVTKTTRPDYEQREYSVKRRFSDFAWLRQKFETDHPMCLIAPLPEKHSVYAIDRFDPDFIRFRALSLDLFLKHIVKHPLLIKHPSLKPFLIANDKDWNRHKKGNSSIRASYEAAWSSLASSFSSGNDPEFGKYSNYAQNLGQRLQAVEKIVLKLHKSEEIFAEDSASAEVIFNHWSCAEESSELRPSVIAVDKAWQESCSALESLLGAFNSSFHAPIKDWILYSTSVQQVMKRRDAYQAEQFSLAECLKRKLSEKDATVISPAPAATSGWSGFFSQPSADVRIQKLTDQIEDLSLKVSQCNEFLQKANVQLRLELERFADWKDEQLSKLLQNFAQQRMEYHRRCLLGWEKAVKIIGKKTDRQKINENSIENSPEHHENS